MPISPARLARPRARFAGAGAVLLCLAVATAGSGEAPRDTAACPDRWVVTAFGAVGDGQADDTAAIQRALDAARAGGGGQVYLPAGNYRVSGSLRVPGGTVLQGIWQAPHHSDQTLGSALWVVGGRGEEAGEAAVHLEPSAAIRGVTFYYPDQSPEAIVAYPYAIRGHGMNGTAENVTLINAYQGIDFGRDANELHTIRFVYGCVLRRGVYISRCTDIGRIENVHFNPHFWARAKIPGASSFRWQALVDYLNANLEAFIFGRTDWEYVFNTFAWGFNVCYRFIGTEHGAANGNFLGCGADGGQTCVLIEETQAPGLLFTNGEFVAMVGDDPTMIRTGPGFRGVAQFTNCSFWGPCAENVELRGDGEVSLVQCNFVHWSRSGESERYAVRQEGGVLMMSACNFREAKPHIYLGPGIRGASIVGNRFAGGPRILNEAPPGAAEIGLNLGR